MKKIVWYALEWRDLLLNMLIVLGGHLFGVALHEIIIHVTNDVDSVFPMGTFMAMFCLAFVAFFVGWTSSLLHFNLSISMGETRHKFYLSYSIQYFLMAVILWTELFVTYQIEKFRLSHFYHGLPVELNLGGMFHPATFVLVPFAMLAIGMILGSVGLRFGSNSKWIIMIIWVAVCLGMSRVADGKIMVYLVKLPTYAYGLIAAGVSLFLMIIAALVMRKQQVTI